MFEAECSVFDFLLPETALGHQSHHSTALGLNVREFFRYFGEICPIFQEFVGFGYMFTRCSPRLGDLLRRWVVSDILGQETIGQNAYKLHGDFLLDAEVGFVMVVVSKEHLAVYHNRRKKLDLLVQLHGKTTPTIFQILLDSNTVLGHQLLKSGSAPARICDHPAQHVVYLRADVVFLGLGQSRVGFEEHEFLVDAGGDGSMDDRPDASFKQCVALNLRQPSFG